jgi:hypothetical protein
MVDEKYTILVNYLSNGKSPIQLNVVRPAANAGGTGGGSDMGGFAAGVAVSLIPFGKLFRGIGRVLRGAGRGAGRGVGRISRIEGRMAGRNRAAGRGMGQANINTRLSPNRQTQASDGMGAGIKQAAMIRPPAKQSAQILQSGRGPIKQSQTVYPINLYKKSTLTPKEIAFRDKDRTSMGPDIGVRATQVEGAIFRVEGTDIMFRSDEMFKQINEIKKQNEILNFSVKGTLQKGFNR